MIRPQRAPVRPRVYVRDSSETVPLEDVVSLPEQRSAGMVAVVGAKGAGKTTALEHLAAIFSSQNQIACVDDADMQTVKAVATDHLVFFTSRTVTPAIGDAWFRLAPWGRDELIEYLLAVHPGQCGPVMDRLARADDRESIPGVPELWRIVLDRMAEDESVTTVHEALVRQLDSCLPDQEIRKLAEDFGRDSLCGDEAARRSAFRKLSREGDRVTPLLRLLGHRIIRVDLAADNLATQLKADGPCAFLTWHLPLDLIEALAGRIPRNQKILARLKEFLQGGKARYHCTAATLLHASGSGWMPKRGPQQPWLDIDDRYGCRKPIRDRKRKREPRKIWLDLAGASLPAAAWPGIDLTSVFLTAVDFTEADLSNADLSGVQAAGACFRHAILANADLSEMAASGADFTSADLTLAQLRHARFDAANFTEANFSHATLEKTDLRVADLTRACFRDALLQGANLRGARIAGADFSNANLSGAGLSGLTLRRATFTGAAFPGARMTQTDLEFMALPDAVFEDANLGEAWLTGSVMPGACFHRACLVGAGLAGVEWEGADLREANLVDVSFHLGSARSGLVDSPIASEGTRTGFYTDDFDQQYFKAPEEIRKANLRGADLRGAWVEKADFYLVDLREARYTTRQLRHFRQCGAILEDRALNNGPKS